MSGRKGNFNGATGLSAQWENCSGSLGGARARGVKGPLSTPQSRRPACYAASREKGGV